MTATLRPSMPLSAWLPLQSAAGAFREECSSLEQLVQELFADLERLGQELEAKADQLEQGRRHLAERGRQLAEQRKESARLSHQFEQQETQLSEALTSLRELRAELANRPEPVAAPDHSADLEILRQQITELQVERAVLLERLEAAAHQESLLRNGESMAPLVSMLSAESLQGLSEQFAQQFNLFNEQLAVTQPNPPATAEFESLKLDLLQQQQNQFTTALTELRALRAEVANRPEATPVSPDALEALATQFAQQFAALHERILSLQQDSPEPTELDALQQERLELEAELELVRARSAELQETVTRQKRELAAQRLEVNEELKELRTLIANQAELFAQHEPATSEPAVHYEPQVSEKSSPPAASGPVPVHEPPTKSPDPVVNSVMAQFAKLQRDIAQRRKKK